jgi:hypothetical protein
LEFRWQKYFCILVCSYRRRIINSHSLNHWYRQKIYSYRINVFKYISHIQLLIFVDIHY